MPFLKDHKKILPTTNYQLLTTNWRQRRPGFTLVEVLIFLLLVLALVMVLLSSAGSLKYFRGTNLQTIATEIASCEIERLRGLPYDNITVGSTSFGPPCDANLTKLPQSSYATSDIAYYQGNPDIKLIFLIVIWHERGQVFDIQMRTLISKYGL